MRKFIILIMLSLGFVSCSEWEPVFTLDYKDPASPAPVVMQANTTIAQLKAMYKDNKPVTFQKGEVIKGQVTSSDQTGNVYRSLYIQDETGAIELKIGKSGLYNDYKEGQWIYVACDGLTLGSYEGMLQLGYEDPSGDYQTSYIDVQLIIDTHIFKGEMGPKVQPVVLSESEILKEENFGKLVTLEDLVYIAQTKYKDDEDTQIFALIYPDPNGDKKSSSNRIFLSGKTYGVTTWAMSKQGFLNYLNAGNFDSVKLADGSKSVSDPDLKALLVKNASAVTVSQYFMKENTPVQIRTSGYSKFADAQIGDAVIKDNASIDVTGILTNYRGSAQFTLLSLDGVKVN